MTQETTEETVVTVGMESESMRMEEQTVTAETQTAGGAAARLMSDMEETMPRPQGKTDSPSKRKGNVSYNNRIELLFIYPAII